MSHSCNPVEDHLFRMMDPPNPACLDTEPCRCTDLYPYLFTVMFSQVFSKSFQIKVSIVFNFYFRVWQWYQSQGWARWARAQPAAQSDRVLTELFYLLVVTESSLPFRPALPFMRNATVDSSFLGNQLMSA